MKRPLSSLCNFSPSTSLSYLKSKIQNLKSTSSHTFTILRLRSGRQTVSRFDKFTVFNERSESNGFTIVELLVVIAVIGILAAITLVSYSGISSRATASALQLDLSNAKKQLALYQVVYGSYPTTLTNNCPSAPTADTKYCLKSSSGNTLANYTSNGSTFFSITATNTNGTVYNITEASSPKLTTLSPTDWLTIGTQTWAKANLNVGTMVTGVTTQTNNSILEKYCYNDSEANCAANGALYQWNEAMQYVTTPGAQGICPTGSHIPTDSDWKILEMQLGMTQAQADLSGSWRGTTQGTQLKPTGSSGLNIPLAGSRGIGGSFNELTTHGYLWSSSESTINARLRVLYLSYTTVYSGTYNKELGFPVRCVGN